jgi:hypothetical protein
VKWTTIRTVVELVVSKRWNIYQNDLKTAFLNGKLSEVVYMQQPAGYAKPGEEHKVCLLNRALYGLKQSQKVWNKTIREELKSMDFKQSKADPCLYHKQEGKRMTIILLYVDDLFITGDLDVQDTRERLSRRFEMTDLGKLQLYLGVEFRYTK